MKPFSFSNKVNNTLLIIPVGFLAYFLMDFTTILNGVTFILVPIYLLYISIGILALLVLSLFTSIKAGIRWGGNKITAGGFD